MAQFTQLAIRQTFLLLLEQTSLDKITVKMIVDACGISRNTFYYHYEDIPALLRDVLESELTRVCGPGGDGQPSPQRLQQLLSYVASHRMVFDRIFHSEYRQQLEQRLTLSAQAIALDSIRACGGGVLDAGQQEAIAVSFSSGVLGLCRQWLADGASVPPEVLLQRLSLFEGLLETTVERALKLGT